MGGRIAARWGHVDVGGRAGSQHFPRQNKKTNWPRRKMLKQPWRHGAVCTLRKLPIGCLDLEQVGRAVVSPQRTKTDGFASAAFWAGQHVSGPGCATWRSQPGKLENYFGRCKNRGRATWGCDVYMECTLCGAVCSTDAGDARGAPWA